MGIVISKTQYAPFPLVTGIIGIISFVFTLGTFLKVVWINIETMGQAPHEVHTYLTNLRTELLEERASIRLMRKQCRKYNKSWKQENGNSQLGIELDEVSLKTMGDTVKVLCKRFKELERPFLEEGSEGIDDYKNHRKRQRTSSVSPYYEHGAYASPTERGDRNRSRTNHERGKRMKEDVGDDHDDAFWAQRTEYAQFNLRRRLIWLRKKSDAQSLFETLSRVQIRRIARQVGGISVLMHEYGSITSRSEEMLSRIDERMNRFVGVRRVE